MVCSSCVAAAEAALARHEGVLEARVSLLGCRAEVSAGCSSLRMVWCGPGPRCSGCHSRSAVHGRACRGSPCVRLCLSRPASTPFLPRQVRYDPDRVGPRRLIQALADAGYEAAPITDERVDGGALREKEKRWVGVTFWPKGGTCLNPCWLPGCWC